MATRSLGTLTLDLIAKTGGFEQGMDRAQRATANASRQIQAEMEKARRTVDNAIKAIGAMSAAVMGVAAAMYRSSAQSIDALSKMSEQIGISTEALSSMRFAAQQFSNVSDGQFDMALRRMTRRINEAATGSGAAAGALKALGLEASQLARLSPEEQFKRLADAMKGVEVQGDRLRYTMAIFDTEGMPLVTALAQGSAELEKMQRLASRLGVTIRDIDAQKIVDAQSAISNVSAAMEGVRNLVAIEIAPTIQWIGELITDTIVSFDDLQGTIRSVIETAKIAGIVVASIFTGRLISSLGATVTAFISVQREAYRAQLALASMAGASTAAATATSALRIALAALGGPVGAVVTALGVAAYGWAQYASSQRSAQRAALDFTDTLDNQIEKFNAATAAQQRSMLLQAEQRLQDLRRLVDETYESMRNAVGLRLRNTPEYQEYLQGLRDAQAGVANLDEVVQKFIRDARLPPAIAESLVDWASKADSASASARDAAEMVFRLHDAFAAQSRAASGASSNLADYEKALAEFQRQYATRSEQMAAEIRKWEEALGGLTPEQRRRIEERFAPPRAGAQSESEAERLIRQLQERIELLRLEAAATGRLSEAQREQIKFEQQLANLKGKDAPRLREQLKALFAQEQALKALIKAREDDLRVRDLHLEAIEQQAEAAYRQAFELERQIKIFGMSESAVARLEVAEARLALSRAESARAAAIEAKASADIIAFHDKEIEKVKQLVSARELLAERTAGIEAIREYERFAEEAQRQNELIGQSLTDALLRGFEDGKSFAENFRDTLRNMFNTLVLRPVIQPIAQQAAGTITNILGLGGQPGGQSIASAFGGGTVFSNFGGSVAQAADYIGYKLWEAGFKDAGNALASSAQSLGKIAKVAGNILGYGMAIYDLTEGRYGSAAGTAIGTAIGGPVGAFIGSMAGSLVDSLFNQPEARYGGTYQYIPGVGTSRPGWERGDPGPQAMLFANTLLTTAADAIQRAFSGVGSDALLTALEASFESSGKGRGGTHSGGVLVIDGQEIRFGTFAKGQGHGGTSGTLEEMMRNAEIDTWQTVIQAWQAAIDEFPAVMQDMIRNVDADSLGLEAAQQLAQQFVQVIEQTNAFTEALRNLPFVPATAATFEYAAALAQSVGGVEEATRLLSSYYQNYYTEAERAAALTEQLTREFAELGFELPRTRDELRGLIEAQMALGEAGLQTLSVLLRLESAFASLVPAGGAMSAAFEAQLQVVRDIASELGRLSSLRTRVGTLLDRINRNTAFSDLREQELWAALQTASYEQQIELASELTDIVLSRYEAEIASVERLRDLGRGLRDYLASLSTSELAPVDLATKVAEAERQLQEAVARARAGDEDALRQIQGLTQNALELWRRYGASGDAYQDAYYRITGMVGDLADQVMSEAERQLAISKETLAQLEQLRDVAETAYNAIDAQYQAMQLSLQNETLVLTELGIQSGQLNVIADLLRGMPASLAAALQPILNAATQSVISDWYAGTGITPDQSAMDYWTSQLSSRPQSVVQDDFYRTLVDNWYKDHLGWSGDIVGIEYWAEQAKKLGPEQAFINFARTAGIPGYWMGGYASGLSLVGERGPELVDFTTPGRVYSNDVLAKVMRGGDEPSNAEIKELLEKVLRAIEIADRNNVAGHSANVNATNQSADKIADATERGVYAAALAR